MEIMAIINTGRRLFYISTEFYCTSDHAAVADNDDDDDDDCLAIRVRFR